MNRGQILDFQDIWAGGTNNRAKIPSRPACRYKLLGRIGLCPGTRCGLLGGSFHCLSKNPIPPTDTAAKSVCESGGLGLTHASSRAFRLSSPNFLLFMPFPLFVYSTGIFLLCILFTKKNALFLGRPIFIFIACYFICCPIALFFFIFYETNVA